MKNNEDSESEFPRGSEKPTRREATSQIARVREHPSNPTRRGSCKGLGRCKGTNSSAKRIPAAGRVERMGQGRGKGTNGRG
jgi:hypothetical protein